MEDGRQPRRQGTVVRALLGTSATFALLIGAFSAYGMVKYVGARGVGVSRDPFGDAESAAVGPCAKNVCNYLLLGSDSRKGLTSEEQVQFGTDEHNGGTSRADTIMLVHIDPRQEKAVVLSFPRDLWVQIPGRGWDKINTSFEGGIEGGGPLRVAKTIHRLTGLTVNHFLYVDLRGFQKVVDTLGGVDMCIPFAVQDPLSALDLKAGCQRLDGQQALAYVRTRHLPCDESAPDLHRIARQQQFLRAVINRMLRPQELVRLPGLIDPVLGNLKRDPGLPVADLAYLVGQLRGVSTGAVDFRAVPGVPDLVLPSWSSSEISILRLDPAARSIFGALRDGRPLPATGTELVNTPPSPANIVTAVLDASSGSAAGQVEHVLSISGFDIAPGIVPFRAGDGTPGKETTIVYTSGHEEEAQVVGQFLPGVPLRQVEHGSSWDVAVVVTPGYRPQPLGGGSEQPSCVSPAA
jgi:LCP family protein required for cell wall assembly